MTAPELEEVLKNVAEEEKRQSRLFGLIAATICNVNRRKGTPAVRPGDFFKERRKPEDFMTVDEAKKKMFAWAQSTKTS